MQFPPSTLRLFPGWCCGLLHPSAKSAMPSCFTSAAINCAGLVPCANLMYSKVWVGGTFSIPQGLPVEPLTSTGTHPPPLTASFLCLAVWFKLSRQLHLACNSHPPPCVFFQDGVVACCIHRPSQLCLPVSHQLQSTAQDLYPF